MVAAAMGRLTAVQATAAHGGDDEALLNAFNGPAVAGPGRRRRPLVDVGRGL
jgi:hypothetical protein